MKSKKLSLIFFWLVLLSAQAGFCQSPGEYEIKAVFIYNFTTFIKWPGSAFETSNSPFVIGVLGDNVFGSALLEATSGEQVESHPIIVKHFSTYEEIDQVHILFIAKNYQTIPEAIEQFKNKPVLTVSDDPQFMNDSGLLRFYNQDNKIRIEINQNLATQRGLEISAKLLKLAKLYHK